jgi:urease accessory protein
MGAGVVDRVELTWAERSVARRVLSTVSGGRVLVDFGEPQELRPGDALVLEDSSLVAVAAATEPLTEVRGRDHCHLMQLAWHLGRHGFPVQIELFRLLVPRERMIEDLLTLLEASLEPVREVFRPEEEVTLHGPRI